MKCAHLTQSVSTLGGGISEVVRALSVAQELAGEKPRVISISDEGEAIAPWPAGSPQLLASRKVPGMQFIPGLQDVLDRTRPDVLHTHGLWTYLSIGGPRWARKQNRPYVVSPHGMLDEWALNSSRAKKKIASLLYERPHLKRASCLHALCQSEADSIRAYGVNVPIAIIPNAVDLPEETPIEKVGKSRRKRLLFLGRVHPKKGLKNALLAWAGAREGNEDWQFVVAGWDQEQHQGELMKICEDHSMPYAQVGIEDYLAQETDQSNVSVVFTGSVFEGDKDQLLREVDAFILPSFSEGLPMSILEAWAYRLPVIMTDHCNLPEGFAAEAAVRIGTDVESVTGGLKEVLRASEEERQGMGGKGFELVKERFTWSQIASKMAHLYRWVAGEEDQPDFVRSDRDY